MWGNSVHFLFAKTGRVNTIITRVHEITGSIHNISMQYRATRLLYITCKTVDVHCTCYSYQASQSQ